MNDTSGALSALFLQEREGLVAEVAEALARRTGTVFRRRGLEATTAAVRRLVATLIEDLAAGAPEQLRTALRPTLGALGEAPPGFRDLRLMQEALREAALSRLAAAGGSLAANRRLEDWLHELTLQCSLAMITRREETIERQASEIEMKLAEQRQLSIPIVPIQDGVLVVPLVGSLDAYRAQVLTDRVLEAIHRSRARFLLLDVSGVANLDGDVVGHLLRTTRAARLLGTQVLLSGISAAAAAALTKVGFDLRELRLHRSLQESLAHAHEGRQDEAAAPRRA